MNSSLNKNILVTAALTAVTFICPAQSYTISPTDSIVATVDFETLTVFNIQQDNNSSDTLSISWEKITDELPPLWTAAICDNGFCYPILYPNGIMDSVYPTGYGLLSLHITAHTNSGTAIIQYAVWETNNPAAKDTLSWVITADQTGMIEVQKEPFTVFVSANTLHLQKNNPQVNTIRIFDVNGKINKQFSLTKDKMQFDIAEFASGIYFVQVNETDIHFVKKILIQKIK